MFCPQYYTQHVHTWTWENCWIYFTSTWKELWRKCLERGVYCKDDWTNLLFYTFNMASLQSFTTRGSGGGGSTLPVGTTDGTWRVSPQDTSHLRPRIWCGAGFRRLRALESHSFKQSRSLPLLWSGCSNECWCLFWAAWTTANRSKGLFVCLHLQYVGVAPWNVHECQGCSFASRQTKSAAEKSL